MRKVDLSVQVGKLKLRNPVMLASGTVGYGDEISEFIDLKKIGAIVTKSISLKPRKGNKPQRILETSAGMLNAIGLANVGIEKFIQEKIPFLRKHDVPIICNIAASTIEEYIECVELLDREEGIHAFEINVSCPNVKKGGLQFGNDVKMIGKITEKVRGKTDKPIIIKLSPNVAYISEFAVIAKKEGADAVSAINTLVGTSFNIKTKRPKLNNVTGGLSGPAIKPIALAKVFEIHKNTDIPVIGIGGIMNWQDAVEFMIAGASAIQLGTVNFIDPRASEKILEGLIDYCIQNKIDNISSLTGSYKLN